jgi:hypothetical protein
MAIKTTIKITKGKTSSTVWSVDGITYGATDPVPNSGMTAPPDTFEQSVNGGAMQSHDVVDLTMRGGATIRCQRVATAPRFLEWLVNGAVVIRNRPGAAAALPAAFFTELVTVSVDPEAPALNGPSKVEITHEYY